MYVISDFYTVTSHSIWL